MATLLTLPLEIRLVILNLVVNSKKVPPPERTADTDRICLKGRPNMRGWISGTGIICDPDPSYYIPNAASLLCTNKQLESEVRLLFQAQNPEPLVYKLDLAVMQGLELWTTWTCIPIKARTVDVVAVKIRGAGPGPPCLKRFRGGDASPPFYLWWFYGMLERLLIAGPEDPNRLVEDDERDHNARPEPQQKLAVRVLDLDFIDSIIPFPQELDLAVIDEGDDFGHGARSGPLCKHCHRDCHRRVRSSRSGHGSLGPEGLFIRLIGEIRDILSAFRMHWGKRIYCGVGIIRFRLRGALKVELNLAESLAKIPNSSVESMERWVADVGAVRTEFGLDVLPWQPVESYQAHRDIDIDLVAGIIESIRASGTYVSAFTEET